MSDRETVILPSTTNEDIQKRVGVPTKKTKIVCTLGPASYPPEMLERMIIEGMDVVRLNFSHGSHDDHRKIFNLIRDLSKKYNEQVSIMCDIQGPKIRTGLIKEPFKLIEGDQVRITPEEIQGSKERFTIRYKTMLEDLDQDDVVFVNDGIVKLRVLKKEASDLLCICEAGGPISSKKGCNIPSGKLSLEVITPKDRDDLAFIAELKPEFVAASFIGTAEDVNKVRKCLSEFGANEVKIISKIERPIALEQIDQIIQASDGIMVARGDLGVEIPTHEVPVHQKSICKKCNSHGKYVIVATQMLESMTFQSRPTRAEASDVFNAVLDGADAVMLSGETAVGNHPFLVVRTMNDIVKTAETHMPQRNPDDYDSPKQATAETIAHATFTLSKEFQEIGWAGKIVVLSESGYTARLLSKYRPCLPMIAVTSNLRTARELNLVWGIRSLYFKESLGTNSEDATIRAVNLVKEAHLVGDEKRLIVVVGSHGVTKGVLFTGIVNLDRM